MSGLDRRQFLARLGAGAAAALTPLPFSLAARHVAAEAAIDPVRAAFAAGLPAHPWLLSVASVEREAFSGQAELVQGKLPMELAGTLYRNGPARHEVAGERYHHSFDGDGVVQAFRIGADGVEHRARLIETRKVKIERAAGRRVMAGFGTPPAPDHPPRDNTEMNVANISVVWHGQRLLALWEGGDAYEIDPEALETVGPHHWSPETAGMPFSAHPRVEPDGTLWNFGTIGWVGKLALYRISKQGQLEAVQLIDLPGLGMIHDFTVTERHLVFAIPPLEYDPESRADTFLDRHVWRGDQPVRVLLVDKNDLSKQTWLEGPSAFVFHFGNAWEESDGTIHLDFCRHPDAGLVFGSLRRVMWGEQVEAEPPIVTKWTINPRKKTVREEIGIEIGEFPSVDPRQTGRRHRHVVTLGRRDETDARHPEFNAVVRHDMESGETDAWTYPGTLLPEEHLIVPRADAAEGEGGWVVGTALDYEARRTQLAVFREEALADGPVAVVRLPYWLPTGLHGRFVRG